jgi:hypothetical protein
MQKASVSVVLSTEDAKRELKEFAARALRSEAAAIVQQLHKMGCEAQLTPDERQ